MSRRTKNSFFVVYEEYLQYSKKNKKTQGYESTKYNFESRILPFFKDKFLEDITSKDIYNWEEYILSLNFSNNYNRNLYYMLSGFFEFCRKFYNFDKTIISNVGCFKKKYEEDKHDFYNLSEFKRFIKYVDEEPYKQFFNFMFFCGTRPGEAMAITFKDIKDDYVIINKTVSNHGKREIGTPKNYSSNRKIIIDNKLKNDLLKLKDFYQRKYKTFSDSYFVFGGQTPLSPSTINRRKEKACNMANLRPITLHQFRHSHATLLIQNGIIINEVSKRLGHSDVTTTLNIYSHTDLIQEKRVQSTLNSMRFNVFAHLKHKIKSLLKRH